MTLDKSTQWEASLFKYLPNIPRVSISMSIAVYVTVMELLASHVTSKVKAYTSSAVRDSMFNIFTVSVGSECPSRLQREDGHVAVTRDTLILIYGQSEISAIETPRGTAYKPNNTILHRNCCTSACVRVLLYPLSSNNLADIPECHIKWRQFLWL